MALPVAIGTLIDVANRQDCENDAADLYQASEMLRTVPAGGTPETAASHSDIVPPYWRRITAKYANQAAGRALSATRYAEQAGDYRASDKVATALGLLAGAAHIAKDDPHAADDIRQAEAQARIAGNIVAERHCQDSAPSKPEDAPSRTESLARTQFRIELKEVAALGLKSGLSAI